MANYTGFGSGRSSFTTARPSAPASPHGAGGFFKNLLGDVRDAAVGIPEGVVQTVEHPIRSVEMGAKATWADWSPLFHGHVGQWWHNTYSHPLAPLLDVATVFTMGGGAAAKLGEVGLLGEAGQGINDASKLTRVLHDTTDAERPAMEKILSSNPATRLRQNATFKLTSHLSQHLPDWFSGHILGPGASYERAYSKFLTHRAAAHGEIESVLRKTAGKHAEIADKLSKLPADQVKNSPDWVSAAHAQIAAELHAGKALSEVDTRKIIEPQLLKFNYNNFREHALPISDGEKLPHGYGYVAREDIAGKRLGFGSGRWNPKDGSFEEHMTHWGGRVMTKQVSRAARNGEGKLLMAPTKAAYTFGREGANSARFLKRFWQAPTTVWKYALVGYSPRTVIDNGIGNWTMLAMRQGGHKLLPAIADTVKQLKGSREAEKLVGSSIGHHWTGKFLDELNQGFAHSLQEGAPITKGGRLRNTLRQGFYPLVHSVADQPVRRTALNAFMRDAPEVKALMKNGEGFDPAVEKALKANPSLHGRAVAHIRKIAGDYTGLTPTERAVRSIVPFYAWDRHIISHTADMLGEHPGRLAALQQLSNQGVAKTKKDFGVNLPDFLLGDVPLGKLGKDARIPALATTGLNPYSTVPDVANALSALVTKGNLSPGETVGGQLNPLVAGLAEQLSGTRLGSTQPIPTHGGLLPSILVNAAEGLPYAKLISDLAGNGTGSTYTSKGKTEQHLYSGDLSEIVSQLLGGPRKKISPTAAQRLYDQEYPKPKSKSKKKTSYTGF